MTNAEQSSRFKTLYPCGEAVLGEEPDTSFGFLSSLELVSGAAANDNKPRVIAFTGVAGSGKSTAADFLVSQGWHRIKFAGPLKAMCRAIGLTQDHIEGSLKERPLGILQGKSPRQFMQLLGTEFGRDMIGPSFWTDLWCAAAAGVMDAGGKVVVDDCRFANEAAAVRALGGAIVQLTGRGGIAGAHVSEAGGVEADNILPNDGSVRALYGSVWRMVA